jgi:ParB/RepB/Spo0J family partition protein
MTISEQQSQVQEVPLDRISLFISRKREKRGFDQLVQSIREHGLIVPITVVEKKDGGFEVIKGQGRCEAHKRLGMKTIRAFVLPDGSVDAEQKTIDWLVENRVRERLPPVVKARLAALDSAAGKSEGEIGRRYGLSTGTVRQYVRTMRRASPAVLDMVESKRLGFTQARAISDAVVDPESQEAVAKLATRERMDLGDTKTLAGLAKRARGLAKSHVTIPELRGEIDKLKRRRADAILALQSRTGRSEVLRQHAVALCQDPSFATLLAKAGLSPLKRS